jgi:hypothetical protein
MDYSVTSEQLISLRNIDVRTVKPEELVDLRDIKISDDLPQSQRVIEFVEQVKNPFCFKVGKIAVSVGFTHDGVTFEQRMENYLNTL